MLTIRALSGGETYASRHLSANDYYAEGERIRGQWMGRGADLLELRGEVTLEQFDAVRQGLHPSTGEFLRPSPECRPLRQKRRAAQLGAQSVRLHRLGSQVGFGAIAGGSPAARRPYASAGGNGKRDGAAGRGTHSANRAACTKTAAPAIW